MSADTGLSDVHRLTADEYHQMIESGGLDEDTRVELIDGLLLDMSPKTREHELAIRWLMKRFFADIDVSRYDIGVGAPLSLGASEPEPDLIIVERDAAAPYHPGTAALVVEVAVSSQRRDLRVKPRLYAAAGVPVYWVIDVDGGRAVMHSEPAGDHYERVEVVTELTAPHVGLAPIAVSDVLAAAGR
ncbi:MAG TPA: Uma2 family endonuclease [Solirubrobacter sp.]|nr:Uma2 family endonuclease [Solirubrobacter sp.]